MVPTADTVRTSTILKGLVGIGRHSMLVGNVGVGKTMVINSTLQQLKEFNTMTINFSAQTSSNGLQVR